MLGKSLVLEKYPPIPAVEFPMWVREFRYVMLGKEIKQLIDQIGHYPQRATKTRVVWYVIPDQLADEPDSPKFIWKMLEVQDQVFLHEDHKDFLYGMTYLHLFENEDAKEEFMELLAKANISPGMSLMGIYGTLFKLRVGCNNYEGLHKRLHGLFQMLADIEVPMQFETVGLI
jgi:hypothetical protein